MEKIVEWICSPLGLIIISFIVGNCLRKIPPIWKVIAYLIIEAIEHLIYPEVLRKTIKRLVHNCLTERQRKLLDEVLRNKGYLHKSGK